MCASCGYPAAPGHWTDAGVADPGERMRARFRRARVLNAVLRAYGLTAHDGGLIPGIQIATLSGARRSWTILPASGSPRSGSLACRSTRSMRASLALAARRPDMAASRDGRMRMTVLGGYLGSGKTTWLRHQLYHGQFKDAFVIVNEAAETPVDDAVLRGAQKLAVLAGGCVCCQARSELVSLLREVCDARSRLDSSGERLQHIVLETSGLADPGPIVEAVRGDSVLVHHIVVSEIIVAVDALNALQQLRSEPLGRAQVEVADRLVVTKIDAAQIAGR